MRARAVSGHNGTSFNCSLFDVQKYPLDVLQTFIYISWDGMIFVTKFDGGLFTYVK